MTTTNTPIPSAARLTEIEQRLTALGDVTDWRGEINPDYGDVCIYLPAQFQNATIGTHFELDQKYPNEPFDPQAIALMAFLGDAPHAIRDLLALVAQVRKLTNSALLPNEQVLAIRELLSSKTVAPRKHVWLEHTNCENLACPICIGGLAVCTVCNGAESELPTDCPGIRMTTEQREQISAGTLDYRNGAWFTASVEGQYHAK